MKYIILTILLIFMFSCTEKEKEIRAFEIIAGYDSTIVSYQIDFHPIDTSQVPNFEFKGEVIKEDSSFVVEWGHGDGTPDTCNGLDGWLPFGEDTTITMSVINKSEIWIADTAHVDTFIVFTPGYWQARIKSIAAPRFYTENESDWSDCRAEMKLIPNLIEGAPPKAWIRIRVIFK